MTEVERNIEPLRKQLLSAFAAVPRPSNDRIALHDCTECAQVRRDYASQAPASFDREIVKVHFDSLPLLSPEAFRYFVVAHMTYALEWPDSTVAEFVLYALAPKEFDDFYRERFALFSSEQRHAVIAFLEFMRSQQIDPEEGADREREPEITAGIDVWRSLA
ncbi:MAG: hypothetical protein IT381_04800 [Deltaproteobacteria bacterium]|nr:hypothetical protein [Deltaproteobacteria bacterium]